MNSVNILNQLLANIQVNYLNNNKFAFCNYNKLCLNVLYLLYKQNLILDYSVQNNKIKITLKYYNNYPLIQKFKNFAKPSLKKYIKYKKIMKLSKEFDYYIISSSKGLILLNNNVKYKIGGKLLFGLKLNI